MIMRRELASPPRMLPLYARAAASLLPGAQHLPWVPGGNGDEHPGLELALAGVRLDLKRLVEYDEVCAFPVRSSLPATYPHVLAFPLHMALMTDRRFALPAVGLVHVANRITQHRPILRSEQLELLAHATALEPHPSGRTFALISEARVAGELVWEEASTMLHREARGDHVAAAAQVPAVPDSAQSLQWRIGEDVGRRYAAVSGDRNPIHLHPLSARAFGFPRAIAHGMWTLARCVAALESRLPDAFTVDVSFRSPILLPADVSFNTFSQDGRIRFWVTDAEGKRRHLEGRVAPGAPEAEIEQEHDEHN